MEINRKIKLLNYLCGRTAIIATCGIPVTREEAFTTVPTDVKWFDLVREFYQFIGHSDYRVIRSPDGKCQRIINATTWGGVIGMTQNEEADFGLCMTITIPRWDVVEFSSPVDIQRWAILTKKPEPYTDNTYFIKVYTPNTLLLIFTTLITVSALSILFDNILTKRTRRKMKILGFASDTLWRVNRLLCAECYSAVSSLLSINYLTLTWLLSLQVFVSCYNNFICAKFAVPTKPIPIDTGQDLLDAVSRRGMKWGTLADSSYYSAFENADGGIMQKLWILSEPHKADWHYSHSDVTQAFDRILEQKYAIVSDLDFGEMQNQKRNGAYHISSSGFGLFFNSLSMMKNSPYKQIVNIFILYAREYGLLNKWEREMVSKRNSTTSSMTKGDEEKPLHLHTVKLVFYVLLAGLTVSTIAFFVELLTHSMTPRKKKTNNRPPNIFEHMDPNNTRKIVIRISY